MPSALETLVKILKLEREQGYNNKAVIGGLAAFGENWKRDAHQQARIPEHHLLVDELVKLLHEYERTDSKDERHAEVKYMLDRITGRVPPPPDYQAPPRATDGEAAGQAQERERAPRREQMKSPPQQSRERDRHGEKKPRDVPSDRRDNGRENGGLQLDIPPQPRLARAPRKPRPDIDADEAAAILRELEAPVTAVKGVGDKLASTLAKLNIHTVNDLLLHLPRRYDDYTRLLPINRLRPNMTATILGTIRRAEVRIGHGGRRDFQIVLDDGSDMMAITFFGQHFLQRYLKTGRQIVVSGSTTIYRHQLQMSNPEWEFLDSDNLHTVGIVPVYPLTEGLRPRTLRRIMKQTTEDWAQRFPDYVPEATLERAELGDLGWALKNLHFPEGWDHLHHAKRRLIFDELLLLQLGILQNRREWRSVRGQALEVTDDFLESFIAAVFPYTLTAAQRRTIEDIRRDVGTDTPMNRLVQGDVGSGKTAVAMTALAMALENGKQGALMAPTSILAEQHYRNVSGALERLPGDRRPVIALLTSALTASERQSIYRGLADGSIDLVVGTHSLIQEGVEFHDLALAVVDEQHRFGVEQRGALRGKGTNPHLLIMTATPIPRTLALTIYADLDLSIIDEMPPGRKPIQTRVVQPVARERVYSFVETQLEEGRQAFIVHPLVEASEQIEAPSALETYEQLQQVFFRFRVGLLHGRMKAVEKDEVMAAFSAGDFDVLVTTSVAEVGVDVPNATVMVIDGANRFGLAQLHQFRGRVGRGEHASYCLLIADSDAPEANERLKAMEDTTDGFRLAEIDWKMRGPGDLLGTRQSGRFGMRLVEEMSPELVELAQREARTIYEEDADLSLPQHRLLAQRVMMRHNDESDLS